MGNGLQLAHCSQRQVQAPSRVLSRLPFTFCHRAMTSFLTRLTFSSAVPEPPPRSQRHVVDASASAIESSIRSHDSSFTILSDDRRTAGLSASESFSGLSDGNSTASQSNNHGVSNLSHDLSLSGLRQRLRSTFCNLPSRRIWLDDLFPEICERIAHYLTTPAIGCGIPWQSTQALLNLAETSPTQHGALLAATRKSLLLDNAMREHGDRWVEAFSSDITYLEVKFEYMEDHSDSSESLFAALVRGPLLRRLVIVDS